MVIGRAPEPREKKRIVEADGRLLALVRDQRARACMQDALRGRARVRFVDRLDELELELSTCTGHLVGVVVEPTDSDGRSVVPVVAALHERLPDLPIIGYCCIGREHSATIRDLAIAGVHEIMFHEIDASAVAIRSILDAAAHARVVEIVFNQVSPLIPTNLESFVGHILRFPEKAHTVEEVAEALGISRRTFVNYCERAHLPAPGELMAWCRLLLVAHYLTRSALTIEAIALKLDFASDTALRNMMKRYTGLRAQDVRAQGGLSCVVRYLRNAIADRQGVAEQVETS